MRTQNEHNAPFLESVSLKKKKKKKKKKKVISKNKLKYQKRE